jgi:hypothetical protein
VQRSPVTVIPVEHLGFAFELDIARGIRIEAKVDSDRPVDRRSRWV